MPSIITWSNLDPQSILRKLEEGNAMPVDAMRDVFHRAGITTAYQEKPCLNPKDPDCPKTAPNSNGSAPDVSAEFTKGCSGVATKYMAWEQDLILGGIKKNKSGHIVRVEAYQSILQLMAQNELFHFFENHQKVSSVDWSPDMAKLVLETFQRKFSMVVNQFANSSSPEPENLHGFSFTTLMDIMKDFSNISVTRVVLGYVLMFIYACVSLLRWNDAVSSQSGIGMAGVILVSLSVAAGLGICSVLSISFNASTTQIIPFLALGLGVDDMFLIAHTYHENVDLVPPQEVTGEVLKRTGVTVLLTSLSNMMAFFTAAIIPIPALRAFTLQAGILVLFNLGSVLLVYPALVSLDLVRRQDKRIDVLCCFQSATGANEAIDLQDQSIDCLVARGQQQRNRDPVTSDPHREPSPPPPYTAGSAAAQLPCYDTVTRAAADGSGVETALAPNEGLLQKRSVEQPLGSNCPSTTSSRQCLTPDGRLSWRASCDRAQRECLTWTLTCLAAKVYAPFLQRTFVKATVIISFLVVLIIGAWGTAQVKDGLDLTDIVPRHTAEFDFLEAQSKYFGFYSISAVTKGDFDYAHNQQILYEYHAAFNKVKKIIKRDDGSLPSFWLDLFRQWLADLQRSFDRDLASGLVDTEGWKHEASEETILAFKLLAQTGDSDHPVNKDQVTRIRLVNEQGHIHPPAFYNYLTAWVSNDAMAYSASMANLHPLPKYWLHDPRDYNFAIHKSQHLVFAQMPFYLGNLSSTEEVIDVITEIRDICADFNERGLPNFPLGDPFTFYEQYIHLRHYLMVSLVAVLAVTFVVLTVVLMNPWTAFIVVFVLSMILVELFGFMGLMGIKLSAVPAVILIMAVGIGVEFTIHLAVGFITAIGSRDRRMALALEHTFAPVVHGAISTFLGILMLVGTEFDFIVKYFFNVLAALVVIGLFNGLMLLPVLLSIIGPKGEVVPKDNGDSLPVPTPEASPQLPARRSHAHSGNRSHHHHHSHHHRGSGSSRRVYPRANSDISLSTISEEPTQYSSHEIVVQPEVVVETTTSVPRSCGYDGAHHQQQLLRPHRTSGSEGGSRAVGARGSGGSVSTVYSDDSSAPDSPPPRPPAHVTRVKATATVKVEVHTPIPGSMNQEHSYKSKRRKQRREDRSPVHSSGSDSDAVSRPRTSKANRPQQTLVFTPDNGISSYSSHRKTSGRSSSRESLHQPLGLRARTSSSNALPAPCSTSSVTSTTVPIAFEDRPRHAQPVAAAALDDYDYELHPLSPEAQRYTAGRALDGKISVLTPNSRRGRRRPRIPHQETDEDGSSEQDVSNA
ncbi:protein patched homolog 1 [Elysia marginata]|uniref:Protein patched homolog 1 n=1 Tax=Elysia marginata TaxID=1093978 RepID=A0AAV4G0R1_9GAST|nr:protein patched homolog 1 [Elysia marginata]